MHRSAAALIGPIGSIGSIALLLAAEGVLAQPPGYPQPLPANLPLFPPDNWWNVPVTSAAVDGPATARSLSSSGTAALAVASGTSTAAVHWVADVNGYFE